MEIWKLNPVFKDYIWGGKRLKESFHAVTDCDTVAESWVLSVHPDGTNIISSGRFAGRSLGEVLKDKSYWGSYGGQFEFFPVMVKLIDAAQNLSIQVHPDDELSRKLENQYGKSEVWYVIDTTPGAALYYGINRDIDRSELETLLREGRIESVLNRVEIKPGDVFMVDAGTIHAICKGALIAEVQQNSNVTYRLFDYHRKDANGNERQLHIDKAVIATSLKARSVDGKPLSVSIENGNSVVRVAEHKYFAATVFEIKESMELPLDRRSFKSIVVLDGSIIAEGLELLKGESAFIPACDGIARISGTGKILVTEASFDPANND